MMDEKRINSETDTTTIKNKKPKDKKNPLTTSQKITRLCIIFIFTVLMIGLIYTIVYKLVKPTADYEGFKSAMRTFLTANEQIVEITIKDNDKFHVTVSDVWYVYPEKFKLKLCSGVHIAIFINANKYRLIDANDENVYLDFYDTTGIKVAKQNVDNFEILH